MPLLPKNTFKWISFYLRMWLYLEIESLKRWFILNKFIRLELWSNMTGVLIKRRKRTHQSESTQRKVYVKKQLEGGTCKERRESSKETIDNWTCWCLNLGLSASRSLRKFLLFKPHRLWCFITAAPTDLTHGILLSSQKCWFLLLLVLY